MMHARLHYLNNLSLRQLRALDRERTVVLLPIGMVEIHGDHLPLGTDTMAVDAIAMSACAWLLEQDESLQILWLPTIPYGIDPIDLRRQELFEDAGSVWIGRETLKLLVGDVAGHMARYGFRHIFPLGFHGGKEHSIALAEVCEELRGSYPNLDMFEPIGYVRAGAEKDILPGLATLLGRPLTAKEEVALRSSIHASMLETSMMLHLRPDLVSREYQTLRTIEWNQIYRMDDWPGYVGAGPAHADPELGAAVLRWWGVRIGKLIVRAMRGDDLTELARHPQWYYEHSPEVPLELAPLDDRPPHIDSKPEMIIPGDELREHLSNVNQDEHPTRPSSDLSTPPDMPRPKDDD